MQTRYSNINDLFSGTGCYPLENLSKDNRWVKLADSLDWDYIEVEYNKRLKNQKVGAGNKPARMVVGALIIKHMLGSSDEGTILSIQENPYMQYFVGLKYFQEEQIFSPELFVTVRKRIDENFFNDILLSMHRKQVKETKASDKEDDSAVDSHAEGFQQTTHKGKMEMHRCRSEIPDGHQHPGRLQSRNRLSDPKTQCKGSCCKSQDPSR